MRGDEARRDGIWEAYYRAPEASRAEARFRLDAIRMVDEMEFSLSLSVAVDFTARKLGVSPRSIFRWRDMVAGVAKLDREAVLVPAARQGRPKAGVHEERDIL